MTPDILQEFAQSVQKHGKVVTATEPIATFADLVDITALKNLLESFTAITGAVTAILDLDGRILIATGWQRICTQFHRVNPQTAARCLESDTILASQLDSGQIYNVYRCKNGLIDIAVPIYVGGEHVANFFTGQFFFEPPKIAQFKHQAQTFGFDEEAYFKALFEVPIFSEQHVERIISFLTRLAQVIGELGLQRRRLELMARTDVLTGLANRRTFDELLFKEALRTQRNHRRCAVLFIDLDGFKTVNDTHGHDAGDRVLIRVARLLEANARATDVVARYGGDEFAILLVDLSDPEAALTVANKICSQINALSVDGLKVGTSIGVAIWPDDTDDAAQLVRLADQAMYDAKTTGKHRVVAAAQHQRFLESPSA